MPGISLQNFGVKSVFTRSGYGGVVSDMSDRAGGSGPVMAVRPSVLVEDVLPAVPPADPSVGWSH
ncbi:hypothetical protein GCM10009602_61790 [Nocardiopsis tropica]